MTHVTRYDGRTNGNVGEPAQLLLIDDDAETLEVLSQVLRRDGFVCLMAEDGMTALDLFRHHRVDAALTDYDLPDLNGIDLIRVFKRERPNVPLALMSGNPSERLLFDACDAGAYTYLRKPLDLQVVRDLMRKLVDSARGGASRYHVTMSHARVSQVEMSETEIRRSSVVIRWGRWFFRRK